MMRHSSTRYRIARVVTALLVAATASCASSPKVVLDSTPAEMYKAMTRDMDRRGGTAAVFEATDARQEQRWAEITRRVEADEIRTAEENFYAGAILVRSSDIGQLLIAESLGRRAAILGDQRGLPVAGEAVDRQALANGIPQKYGTQYVYSHVTGNWQLYLLDPATTDEQRAAAGLPSRAWFDDRIRQLNDSEKSVRLRRELRIPPVD